MKSIIFKISLLLVFVNLSIIAMELASPKINDEKIPQLIIRNCGWDPVYYTVRDQITDTLTDGTVLTGVDERLKNLTTQMKRLIMIPTPFC